MCLQTENLSSQALRVSTMQQKGNGARLVLLLAIILLAACMIAFLVCSPRSTVDGPSGEMNEGRAAKLTSNEHSNEGPKVVASPFQGRDDKNTNYGLKEWMARKEAEGQGKEEIEYVPFKEISRAEKVITSSTGEKLKLTNITLTNGWIIKVESIDWKEDSIEPVYEANQQEKGIIEFGQRLSQALLSRFAILQAARQEERAARKERVEVSNVVASGLKEDGYLLPGMNSKQVDDKNIPSDMDSNEI